MAASEFIDNSHSSFLPYLDIGTRGEGWLTTSGFYVESTGWQCIKDLETN